MKLIYQRKREDDLADYTDRLLQRTDHIDPVTSLAAASDQQLVQSLCIFLRASRPDQAMHQRIRERLHQEWARLRRDRSSLSLSFG